MYDRSCFARTSRHARTWTFTTNLWHVANGTQEPGPLQCPRRGKECRGRGNQKSVQEAGFDTSPGQGGNTEKFQVITRAHEVLSDSAKRMQYNKYIEKGFKSRVNFHQGQGRQKFWAWLQKNSTGVDHPFSGRNNDAAAAGELFVSRGCDGMGRKYTCKECSEDVNRSEFMMEATDVFGREAPWLDFNGSLDGRCYRCCCGRGPRETEDMYRKEVDKEMTEDDIMKNTRSRPRLCTASGRMSRRGT